MSISINHISVYLPHEELVNSHLAQEFGVTEEQIIKSTNIQKRHISATSELSSDMAVKAGVIFFEETNISKDEIDFLIFCSEGFDYIAPASSCLIQHRLQLPTTVGCIDLPYGCSGYVYGIGIAYGLLKSGIAKKILFITADIPTKVVTKNDLELRSIFSDAATASLITLGNKGDNKFVYGTDGKGAHDLYVEKSAFRPPLDDNYKLPDDLVCGQMLMNGTNIFLFAVKKVPILVHDVLQKNNLSIEDVDLFVFHQASYYILEVVRKKLKIPKDKVFINIQNYGNTVSSSIPLALYDAEKSGTLKRGMKVLLAGFGIGNSWGATIVDY